MKHVGVVAGKTTKRERQRLQRNLNGLAMLALLAVVLSGCGAISSSNKDAAATSSAPMAETAMMDQKNSISNEAAQGNSAPQAAGSLAKSESLSTGSKPADSFNGGISAEPSAVDRKIIYKANLTMQVEKYAEAQAKIEEAVSRSGGYVLQFSENETSYEKSGSFSIKVPASGFGSLLSQIEKISPSVKKNMQGQDVSEEFVDLTSRLKAKQVVESRLIVFMEKAVKTDELLAFSNELGKVQEEIERIKGRMRYLEQNVAYSTIEVRMAQKLGTAAVIQANDRGPLFQRAAEALNGSATVLSVIFQWLVVIVAAVLPVALVLSIIGIPIWLLRRSKKKKLVELRKKLTAENSESLTTMSDNPSSNDRAE
ncbi:DUF4349 domain-containing protein [Paenibacillus radicis (ex Xue et al. 2023)]|uniref:DUF4349 domain-containing protein n=1 Tax=Paenibacillus radicis (ex Xue et al. 2023) TaxID=2972489 RepID=A0ABT1YP71_9BACL|nr:DUF4349 domain-containing protein [Paenibacillus radicis (ex Xue et al. 2023)]MCR8634974.1 DUF4349 domain-containing protein [Paenibacillus radicis (ex Xue et al. 2023)]